MESYRFLLDIGLILLSTKFFGLLTQKFQMPQVVGALVAGLLLGPACFGIVQGSDLLTALSEIGVVVIMFTAGMTTDIKELKSAGKAGLPVAIIGVVVPLAMGTGLGFIFAPPGAGMEQLLQHIFIGTILTATSVSITVETLKEIGKLNTQVGNTILAAALIDDVLGLVVLTVVTGLGGSDVNILFVLLKIVLFFLAVVVVGMLCIKVLTWYENRFKKNLHRFPLLAFVLCLFMAYGAEELFGVADIIGAFSAGLIIANTPKGAYIESKFEPLSFLLLTPIFFASVGLKVVLPEMTPTIILFTIALVVVAVVSKLIGCGLGAKLCGFSNRKSLQIGVGMVCRGEVALIVANKGAAIGLMPEQYFGPIIIMVVLCTVLTPIFLKIVFKKKKGQMVPEALEISNNALIDRYEMPERMEEMAEADANRYMEEQENKKKAKK